VQSSRHRSPAQPEAHLQHRITPADNGCNYCVHEVRPVRWHLKASARAERGPAGSGGARSHMGKVEQGSSGRQVWLDEWKNWGGLQPPVGCVLRVYDGVGENGMEWNAMERNGMAWYGMDWNGVAWDGMEWLGMGWNEMAWNGVGWYGMGWHGMAWNDME
jgi:hypothetical protein